MDKLDKTFSFRVSEEIYTTFLDKYGDVLPQFLRACLEWACDTDYKTISPVFFHQY